MKINVKRRFMCELLSVAVLMIAASPLQAHPAESTRPVGYCPRNDPDVLVHAEIKSIEMTERDANQIGFRAHVMISIANTSAESVFVLAGGASVGLEHDPDYGAISLSRTKEDALSCRHIYNRGVYPGIDRSAWWQDLRKQLDHQTPSPAVIHTIAPGSSWEFERDILFGMWKDPMDHGHALNEILSDPHGWLRVEFLMWPNNLEKDMLNPIFGRSLQKRWKTSGHLMIENVWSEPVEVTLPLNRERHSPQDPS